MLTIGIEKMNAKYILYLGILLLLIGLFLRYLTPYTTFGVGLVFGGVILKLAYIGYTILRRQYQPKAEIFLLIGGLVFLFLGLWHKLNVSELVGYGMIILAIALKSIFIILFVRKMKMRKTFVNQ